MAGADEQPDAAAAPGAKPPAGSGAGAARPGSRGRVPWRIVPIYLTGEDGDELNGAAQDEAERSAQRSKVAAIVFAAVVHLLVAAIAAIVVMREVRRGAPEITVTAGYDEQAAPRERVLETQRVVNRRPSGEAAARANVVTAAAPADFALPVSDAVDDVMDFGPIDTGDGIGFGSSGAFGGAQFLGLSAGSSRHIVLLIDVSGSMLGNCGPAGLEAIKREVARTVNSLAANVRFNIFTFAGDVDGFKAHSVPATADMKREAIAFFDAYFTAAVRETRTDAFGPRGVDPSGVAFVPITSEKFRALNGISGSTRVELGVVAAMQDRPSTIFVISDGEPQSRRDGRQIEHPELIELIQREYRRLYGSIRQLRIGTISVDGKGAGFLRRLADAFGGDYRSIRPAEL